MVELKRPRVGGIDAGRERALPALRLLGTAAVVGAGGELPAGTR
jgi:hypothetical protein